MRLLPTLPCITAALLVGAGAPHAQSNVKEATLRFESGVSQADVLVRSASGDRVSVSRPEAPLHRGDCVESMKKGRVVAVVVYHRGGVERPVGDRHCLPTDKPSAAFFEQLKDAVISFWEQHRARK